MGHHHRTVLCDLPDSCLLQIFKHLSPLPDEFNVGACCWRFYRLVSDRRLWLVVSPNKVAPDAAPGGAGPVYPTLSAAVKASRPGDTIWLAPGVPHSAADVTIPWPLHLLGGGALPSDTWLVAPQGTSDCALCFTASAKVTLLSVSTTLCPCIVHKRGSLTLQHCVLAADPKGLHHLVSPVLTLAAGDTTAAVLSSSSGSSVIEEQASVCTGSTVPCAELTVPPMSNSKINSSSSSSSRGGNQGLMSAAMSFGGQFGGIGPGKLQVVECQIMGGSTAVRCGGTGQLRNVRAIYESCSKAPYFWLDVDSADGPGTVTAAAVEAAAAVDAGLLWQQPAAVLLAQHEQQAATADTTTAAAAGCTAVDSGDGSAASKLLQQRSKAWQQHREQQQQQVLLPADGHTPAGAAVGASLGVPGLGPTVGLARIQAVLGQRSINPASLAAHLTARQQLEQAQQQHQQQD